MRKLLTMADTMAVLVLHENDVNALWAWFCRQVQNDTNYLYSLFTALYPTLVPQSGVHMYML